MSNMGHVLAVPEQAMEVCNSYTIHIMKLLDISSMLKPKKKSPKSNLAHFGLKSSHCGMIKVFPMMNKKYRTFKDASLLTSLLWAVSLKF